MSRSVSAPSSVTKTSPCWNGLIVPGSTLMYGSNFCTCTFSPRAFSRRPSEAAVMPLPRDETTPPVTKTYFGGRAATSPGATRSSWLAPPRVQLTQNRHSLDQLAQRARLSEEGEAGKGADRDPTASSREFAHGTQA